MRALILDMNNLCMRAVHVIKNAEDQRDWISRTYAIVFQSIIKLSNKFIVDHVVACFDSYSWREEIYKLYKENRRHDLTERKLETKKISHTILRDLSRYLRDKTNVTVLEAEGIEADDFIARWIQRHQHTFDSHIIISNDADFKQLVAPGTDLYDPIPGILYTSDGIYFQDQKRDPQHPTGHRYEEMWKIRYLQPKITLVYRRDWDDNYKGQKGSFVYPISNYPYGNGHLIRDLTAHGDPIRIIRMIGNHKGFEYLSGEYWLNFPVLTEKTPLLLHPSNRIRLIQQRETFNPRWELFLKCIRGDNRDNIRSSFPRVPETKLRKAFTDKTEYVKLINDSFGRGEQRQQVKPLFEMNQRLIDLTAQPDEIKARMDAVIDEMTNQPVKQMVELYFDQFITDQGIRRLSEMKANILPIISRPYRKNR